MAADKSQTSMNYATGEVKESVNSSFNSSFAAHYPFQNQDPTPLCNKISTVLGGLGYSTVQFIPTDVDSESNTISVFVLESWAETVLSSLMELSERLNSQKNAAKDAAMQKRMGEVSKDTLHSKVKELQGKLQDTERREKALEAKIMVLEQTQQSRSASSTSDDSTNKKLVKNLEQQLAESERRGRLREKEVDKLREKLLIVAEKEKETAAKNLKIFTQFKQGDISVIDNSASSSSSNRSTPASKFTTPTKSSVNPSPRATPTPRSAAASSGTSPPQAVSASGVVEALEEQRVELALRNRELVLQVRDLTTALKDAQNKKSGKVAATAVYDRKSRQSGGSVRNYRTGCGGTNNKRYGAAGGGRSSEDEDDADDDDGDDDDKELTPVARQMYDKIIEQKNQLEKLQRMVELSRERLDEAAGDIAHWRAKCAALREEVENLQLEVESRPNVKQWTAAQREIKDLEDKLADLTVMRGDSAEIAAWRKHLSTADRIKVDKRNHELGLWLLDSLPKTVMKEVLQSICRELDITDISDIRECIIKLKAVVKTVPRMERFISQVCAFVFERDPTLVQHAQQLDGGGDTVRGKTTGSTMEDVFPMLKRWWAAVLRSFDLAGFNTRILQELHRRELMVSQLGLPNKRRGTEAEVAEHWASVGRLQWAQRDPVGAVQIIRDLVDFEQEVMHNKASLLHAAEFVRDQPAVIVNRIVGHVQYLFEIKSLEGVLPRMNQVYLFTEEMRNFLATVRALLGTNSSAAVPNSVLLAEIERRISIS